MINRDRGADDDEKKYNLQISLTRYASDMIKEVVDSAEYEHMLFETIRSKFFYLLSDSSNASTD